MRVKSQPNRRARQNQNLKKKNDPLKSFGLITACAFLAVLIAVGSKAIAGDNIKNEVYAAADAGQMSAYVSEEQERLLSTGIKGVITGVQETPAPGSSLNRIGTSCEQVLVGQRVKTVKDTVTELNVSANMEAKVNELDAAAVSMAQSPKIMSDTDYDTLLSIVEAEAGGEDIKGRILVANVIMNRVKSDKFPNSVTEVVWEYVDGVPQFSPTYDGRIGTVTVSDDTREAVKQALEGVDYSEGALFFIQKSAAESHNVTWFEKDLKKLFKHGVHEFYTYPEE